MNIKQNNVIEIAKEIVSEYIENPNFSNILVAGCGLEEEVVAISTIMGAKKTLGIDINIEDKIISSNVKIEKQDLTSLNIDDGSIDFIYSYHVLEHVNNPEKALIEMQRVLKPYGGGVLYIGFPNRNRLIGNMGTCHNYSISQRMKQNFIDWKHKITGRFKNKYGAHAGFTEKEFLLLTNNIFSEVICVRNDYFYRKYNKKINIIKFLVKFRLSEFLFASNYFICKK